MAEIVYVDVVWTAGDTITEAKLDNMTANDRAVDSHQTGIEMAERSSPSTPGANKVHIYVKDKSGVPTIYAINDAGTDYEISENRPAFVFTVQDTLAVGSSVTPVLIVHKALEIVKAYGYSKTAPVGADILITLKKNGTSIWATTPANRLTIADGANSGNQTNFDTVALAEGDVLTMDVDQVGSTTPGSDLTVVLRTK